MNTLNSGRNRVLHSVALVFSGWYLMVPPQTQHAEVAYVQPNTDAPMKAWQAMQGPSGPAYVSKQECEDFRSRMVSDAKKILLTAPPGLGKMVSTVATVKWAFALEAVKSQCIASDDPRLKAN